MLHVKDIKNMVRGRWEPVLLTLAPEVWPALERAPRHVPCPVHGGIDGFRMFRNWQEDGGGICNTCGTFPDGFELIKWLRGWTFKEALAEVAKVASGGQAGPVSYRRQPAPPSGSNGANLRARLQEVWKHAFPLAAPEAEPARRYLASRAITVFDVPGLRLHPDLPYYEAGGEVGRFPALLGLFLSPARQGITLHRIYLTRDGRKAPVPAPKKTMPVPGGLSLSGAAIRLGPAGPVLGLAEGIETALAVMTATGDICWATTSACLLEKVKLPPVVRRVTVWADNDESKTGLKAAARLAERLVKEGRKVQIKIPQRPQSQKTWDWADVLLETHLNSADAYSA